ncbi:uncharacterized protein LAJ45_03678 [Morchella importuna]|uniref:uncharacterized protein n=1 Tax=Morchella importuna TaxID=1174673 RepID=UPI001E8E33CA|nr:uncharacterized protein LAJ45_03678 [Morchella importuna]KAH8152252.1 hypothetical protein LAJ45_03678 [Morchella importuna]
MSSSQPFSTVGVINILRDKIDLYKLSFAHTIGYSKDCHIQLARIRAAQAAPVVGETIDPASESIGPQEIAELDSIIAEDTKRIRVWETRLWRLIDEAIRSA